MSFLERCLKDWSLVICLTLGLLTAGLLSSYGIVGPDAMPFSDGQRYAVRAFTLYGYLHDGQWDRFWDLLTLDKTSALAPLHYWIFFLVPQSWAGITAYGTILGTTNYLVLAFGAWAMCHALDRKEWAPLLFLLCATQNISIDKSYFYFCDVTFFAFATVAMAAQLRAWQKDEFYASILSGALAALLFWVKPANALLFAITYAMAELARVGLIAWRARSYSGTGRPLGKNLRRHFAGIVIGFLPILLLAVACGALQTIMRLLDANEVSNLFSTHLDCTGLKRFFYFPLCLTFFYHTLLMVALGVIVVAVTLVQAFYRRGLSPVAAIRPFPWDRLAPLLAAYFIWGEYFSFGMDTKTMRSMLLVLPPLWLLAFWMAERLQTRTALLLVGILAYVVCAYSQGYFQTAPYKVVYAEDYQLTDDWLERFPPPLYANQNSAKFTRGLLSYVEHVLPAGGKVAIGSDMIYLNSESFAWYENSPLLIQGKPPIFNFDTFLNFDGRYKRQALVNAVGIVLYTHPSFQYSEQVSKDTYDLLVYSQRDGVMGDQIEGIGPLHCKGFGVVGYMIVFKQPITEGQVDDLVEATQAPGYAVDQEQFSALHDRRLSWHDCYDILFHWLGKHLGSGNSPPPL